MDDDDNDDQWRQDVEGLLLSPPEPADGSDEARGSGENDADDDFSRMADGLLGLGHVANNSAAPARADPVQPVSEALEDAFGPAQQVSALCQGQHVVVQSWLFRRYRQNCQARTVGQKAAVSDAIQNVRDSYVTFETVRSVAAVAASAGLSKQTVGRALLQFACALLHGACFLLGCFLHAWQRMLAWRYTPVAAFVKQNYDETPLRLRLEEYFPFFDANPAEVSNNLASDGTRQAYKYAKVLRIECSVGCWAALGPGLESKTQG